MFARKDWHSKILTILLGLGLSLIFWSPAGSAVDNYLYDAFFYFRGTTETPEKIVLIAIDESSFEEINLRWPWPRSLHGELVTQVFNAGAKTLAFDILFAEPSEDDEIFGAAIAKNPHVVLVNDINIITDPHYGYEQVKIIEPGSIIKYAEGKVELGFANMRTEPDGFIRRVNTSYAEQQPFSLVAAKMYAAQTNTQIAEPLPSEEEEHGRWINFLGPPRTIKTISYYQALNPEEYLPPDYLKDALVFVGFATASEVASGTSSIDHYPAPFSRWGWGYYPGVEIHAQAAAGFLTNTSIFRFPTHLSITSGLTLGCITGLLIISSRLLIGTFIFILISSISFLGVYYLFSENRYYLSPLHLLSPLAFIFILNPFLQYLHSLRQRRFIKDAFSTYLAPQVVKQILANPKKLTLGGEEMYATIFFLDISGFTSMSEKLLPKELIEVINRSLGSFSEIILTHEGMIDKFIGDCIMAVWGLPLPQNDHERRAVTAAIKIKEALPEIQKAEKERTGSELSFRIGISTGKVIAGNVGGGKRFNYTALGNDVNLAARLESLNKQYGTQIMISQTTASSLDPSILLRKLDKVKVVGQNTPVEIYEVCGNANTNSHLLEKINHYHTALEQYFTKDFSNAKKNFLQAQKCDVFDKASSLLLHRCEEFIQHPPDENWDGVFVAKDK
jgi:adenylate cyclase